MMGYGLLLRDHVWCARARSWLVLTGRGVCSTLFGNLRRRMKRRTELVKALFHHFCTRWNRCRVLAEPVREVGTVRILLRGRVGCTQLCKLQHLPIFHFVGLRRLYFIASTLLDRRRLLIEVLQLQIVNFTDWVVGYLIVIAFTHATVFKILQRPIVRV